MSTTNPPYPHAEQMRNHWWWRPGWRVGRRFYTWHITFADQPEVHRRVADCQTALNGVPALDLVPLEWLHLTVQGVGFTDQITQAELDQVIDAVRHQLREAKPIDVELGPSVLHAEAVALPATPPEPLVELRDSLRAGITHALGTDRVEGVNVIFRPHVTVAYNTADRPTDVILDALSSLPAYPTKIRLSAIMLIELRRDHHVYLWDNIASVALEKG